MSQPGRHYPALRDLAYPAPARGRARRQGFTPNATRWARSHILVAIQFLAWLDEHDTSLAAGTSVPVIPHTWPAGFPRDDARWQLLRRCLDDTSMPLDVRAARTLLLLYGQFATRLARMTAGDLAHDGHDT